MGLFFIVQIRLSYQNDQKKHAVGLTNSLHDVIATFMTQ